MRRYAQVRTAAVLCWLVVSAACVPAGPATAGVAWHEGLEQALEAADRSGKPIVAFVYLSEGEREQYTDEQRERLVVPGRQMLRETLVDAAVAEAAKAFETVKLDLRDPSTNAARRLLNVSPVSSALNLGPESAERVGAFPVTLFLDEDGAELYRRHGYLPPGAYAAQLERTATLFRRLREAEAHPDDPVVRRNLGRAYMEMDFAPGDQFHEAAVSNLEDAIRLDPDNEAGARFDAEVDLAILRMPEDPAAALEKLRSLKPRAERERRLEIEYYTGVAHYVLGDTTGAVRVLSRFETEDRDSAYYDSRWTPQALGLLKHIRQRQGG